MATKTIYSFYKKLENKYSVTIIPSQEFITSTSDDFNFVSYELPDGFVLDFDLNESFMEDLPVGYYNKNLSLKLDLSVIVTAISGYSDVDTVTAFKFLHKKLVNSQLITDKMGYNKDVSHAYSFNPTLTNFPLQNVFILNFGVNNNNVNKIFNTNRIFVQSSKINKTINFSNDISIVNLELEDIFKYVASKITYKNLLIGNGYYDFTTSYGSKTLMDYYHNDPVENTINFKKKYDNTTNNDDDIGIFDFYFNDANNKMFKKWNGKSSITNATNDYSNYNVYRFEMFNEKWFIDEIQYQVYRIVSYMIFNLVKDTNGNIISDATKLKLDFLNNSAYYKKMELYYTPGDYNKLFFHKRFSKQFSTSYQEGMKGLAIKGQEYIYNYDLYRVGKAYFNDDGVWKLVAGFLTDEENAFGYLYDNLFDYIQSYAIAMGLKFDFYSNVNKELVPIENFNYIGVDYDLNDYWQGCGWDVIYKNRYDEYNYLDSPNFLSSKDMINSEFSGSYNLLKSSKSNMPTIETDTENLRNSYYTEINDISTDEFNIKNFPYNTSPGLELLTKNGMLYSIEIDNFKLYYKDTNNTDKFNRFIRVFDTVEQFFADETTLENQFEYNAKEFFEDSPLIFIKLYLQWYSNVDNSDKLKVGDKVIFVNGANEYFAKIVDVNYDTIIVCLDYASTYNLSDYTAFGKHYTEAGVIIYIKNFEILRYSYTSDKNSDLFSTNLLLIKLQQSKYSFALQTNYFYKVLFSSALAQNYLITDIFLSRVKNNVDVNLLYYLNNFNRYFFQSNNLYYYDISSATEFIKKIKPLIFLDVDNKIKSYIGYYKTPDEPTYELEKFKFFTNFTLFKLNVKYSELPKIHLELISYYPDDKDGENTLATSNLYDLKKLDI